MISRRLFARLYWFAKIHKGKLVWIFQATNETTSGKQKPFLHAVCKNNNKHTIALDNFVAMVGELPSFAEFIIFITYKKRFQHN